MEAPTLMQPHPFEETSSTQSVGSRCSFAPFALPPLNISMFPQDEQRTLENHSRSTIAHQQLQQNNTFSFSAYAGTSLNADFQRYLPRQIEHSQQIRSFKKVVQRQDSRGHTKTIKSEPLEAGISTGNMATVSSGRKTEEVSFGTGVDVLMKAIQAKPHTTNNSASLLLGIEPLVRTSST
jgi:hypothetical protein